MQDSAISLVSGNQDLLGVELAKLVPSELLASVQRDRLRSIPAIAKDPESISKIEDIVKQLPATHRLMLGDSRELMRDIPDESVHLAVTSPPYWTLKRYKENDSQLGHVDDYEQFLCQIDKVWEGVHRALAPGGRLVIVVGDVCLSRRKFGRHVVVPLHASIQEHCRALGYDNLAPLIWHKIANANYEVGGNSGFLGKPYEPNAVIKNDIEYILFQRKPGGYRTPSPAARVLSVIPANLHQVYFQQIWSIAGASTRKHPAPFPLSLAKRLVRMFSFVGDTVLDPFLGIGTTSVAAAALGRNSLGIEVEPAYYKIAKSAVSALQSGQRQMVL